MHNKIALFEKYAVTPSPIRDYYGIKVFDDEVILYIWRVSHGPHLLPIERVTKFSDFNRDKLLKEEILHVFGSTVLKYLELITLEGAKTLLTLPKQIVHKLVKFLSLKDIAELLCTSPICDEIFNTNSVWELIYKRLKRSSKLSDMEKEIGASQGFKKLAHDHQVRNTAKKTLKAIEERSAYFQKPVKPEKFVRASPAPVALPKSILTNAARKQSVDDTAKKAQKSQSKSSSKAPSVKEKKLNLPKKSASEEKSSIYDESHKILEKLAAGEGYRTIKLANATVTSKKSEQKMEKAIKAKFLKEEKEKAELLMQKKLLKSALLQTDISDAGSEDYKVNTIRSPRSIFTKYSIPALGELKAPSDAKDAEHKKLKKTKSKTGNTAKLDLKSLMNERKNEESDDSGMSYLMKRYLEASQEVTKKFSECERLPQTTRNSSTQVDMGEKPQKRVVKKSVKHAITANRPVSRGAGSNPNLFSKLKNLKKN